MLFDYDQNVMLYIVLALRILQHLPLNYGGGSTCKRDGRHVGGKIELEILEFSASVNRCWRRLVSVTSRSESNNNNKDSTVPANPPTYLPTYHEIISSIMQDTVCSNLRLGNKQCIDSVEMYKMGSRYKMVIIQKTEMAKAQH